MKTVGVIGFRGLWALKGVTVGVANFLDQSIGILHKNFGHHRLGRFGRGIFA